jgi:hypothetical protein
VPAANPRMILARSHNLTADVRLAARDFSFSCACSSNWMFSAPGIGRGVRPEGFLAAAKVN